MAEQDLVTVEITAENTFTDPIVGRLSEGFYVLGIDLEGITDSTVTIQRRKDAAATWKLVDTFTEDIQTTLFDPMSFQYRIGVATGGYGTDTIDATLWKVVSRGRN